MGKSLEEMKARLSPEMRARVDARAAEMLAQLDGRQPLRTAMPTTRVDGADTFGIPGERERGTAPGSARDAMTANLATKSLPRRRL